MKAANTSDAKKDKYTVFWSWQSDSDSTLNRNFIENCIKAAIKSLQTKFGIEIILDKDTANIAGSPVIANTIMSKISDCDTFIWDSTLVFKKPKPSPNPNVLIEFGYALSAIGDEKIIGVFNSGDKRKPSDLPFDLKHRRYPIDYKYDKLTTPDEKIAEKKKLTDILIAAMSLSLFAERKNGIDKDYYIAKVGLELLNSSNISLFMNQFDTQFPMLRESNLDDFAAFCEKFEKHEYSFASNEINDARLKLLKAVKGFINKVYGNMSPSHNPAILKLDAKFLRQGHDDYDAIHKQQTDAIINAKKDIESSWNSYVSILTSKFPSLFY